MITIEQAFEQIAKTVSPLQSQQLEMGEAVGRTLAEPVVADVDSPPHTKSVMDGFAVRAADLKPGARFRLVETIVAGDVPSVPLVENCTSRIMTGAPLPDGADAVVILEQSSESAEEDGTLVEFEIDQLLPGQHTMAKAASFAKGETIFAAGHRLKPLDIGLLAEVGATKPRVFRQPMVAVLPTGNELVDASERPAPGQIRNSNGPMLCKLLQSAGSSVVDLGVGIDRKQELREKIEAGLQHDLLVLSGGVSAGMLDLVPGILRECGVEEVFHKVRVKPGKPIWFGIKRATAEHDDCVVIGLPGNPVSSLVGFQMFVRAILRRFDGNQNLHPDTSQAILASDHEARGDRPTWWPGRWQRQPDGSRIAEPLKWLGSSDLRPLGQAELLIHFPVEKGQTGGTFPAGTSVEIFEIN